MKHTIILCSLLAIFLVAFSIEKHFDVKVSKNNTFQIELPYIAGTGYSWMWINQDSIAFDSVSVEYKQQNEHLIGGAGTMIWTFKAKSKGDFTLTFENKRPWEETAIEQKTFSVRVK